MISSHQSARPLALLHLPNEMLEAIALCLETQRDIYALVRTNHQLHDALNSTLYRRNVDDSGGSALTWAVIHGREETAIKAINAGASGGEALWRSVQNKDEKMAKLILSSGNADGNFRDSEQGETPLLAAVRLGDESMLKLLLSSGKVKLDSYTADNSSALMLAIDKGHEDIAKMLLDQDGVDVNHANWRGHRALSLAAAEGFLDVVKMLIGMENVVVDFRGRFDDYTPLAWACKKGHLSIVELLLDSGRVDPNPRTFQGCTPFMLASENGHSAVMRCLVDTGRIDVWERRNNGATAFSSALDQGHLSALELIMESIESTSVQRFVEVSRETLTRAVYARSLPITKLLLDSGLIDINEVDSWGKTALHHACRLHAEDIVAYLLQREDIDANVQDDTGFTPLMVAAASSRGFRTVKIFLQSGKVDVALQNHDGATAISIARIRRRYHTRQLLERWDRRSKGE
ncbi:unnamed protein product [Clonostachys byssicola]|uniref:Uncharacterized protein n=1 Tax=Clonostachys byssicola TaxID=160290 RepID=A0A9N9Y2Q5_9HYPO|nr:unnamed protein product [Clonostachys byssicola]